MLYRRSAITVVATAFLILASLTWAQQANGIVQRVVDGDTIVVVGVGTVRLIGVDTPETVDPRKPVQHFGAEASTFLRQLVAGKQVRLEYEGARLDKYNRTLAYVYLLDGTFVNLEIVRQGYGHAYTQFPFRLMDDFREAQRAAMQNSRGLWAQENPPGPARPLTAMPPSRATPASSAANETETVYATRTGTKYHRARCRFLARSQIPMSLKDAAARYGPCSVCSPPLLKTPPTSTPAAAESVAQPRKSPPVAYPFDERRS